MTTIVLKGCSFSENRGSAAILLATVKTLLEFIPDADFVLLSPNPDTDRTVNPFNNLSIVDARRARLDSLFYFITAFLVSRLRRRKMPASFFNGDQLMRVYLSSDLIIDLSGDAISEDYGRSSSVGTCVGTLYASCSRTPVILLAQSIGPFYSEFTRAIARFCLSKVELITAREGLTHEYLGRLGLGIEIRRTADMAFLLDPAPPDRVDNILGAEGIAIDCHPVVGISPSQHIYELLESSGRNGSDYLNSMAGLVDFVSGTLGGQIIMVPHVTSHELRADDRSLASELLSRIRDPSRARVIRGEYTASELKGVISRCDLFVGGRMHANISAISCKVPTIAIAYSHKTLGIMCMAGLSDYTLSYDNLSAQKLIGKLRTLWSCRDSMRLELEGNVAVIENLALVNGECVREVLSNRRSASS